MSAPLSLARRPHEPSWCWRVGTRSDARIFASWSTTAPLSGSPWPSPCSLGLAVAVSPLATQTNLAALREAGSGVVSGGPLGSPPDTEPFAPGGGSTTRCQDCVAKSW